MFKEISKSEFTEIDKSRKKKKKIYEIRLKFTPYEWNHFHGDPITIKIDELSNEKKVDTKTRYEYGEILSKCRKKEIWRERYETNIYEIDGRKVEGAECYKGGEWIQK